ncbi:bromodomain-containing protein DDB_G0270170 [Chelonus insularis]|uniref:bromodomain-containing protein DDB_G0270170 n=1 Tax=Chelonus insularis TaxID=460826 RepID=UPI00158ED01B|nr:bromodomain-containing protein DDB_G0270170 [Chelonus insularis]
MEESGVQVKFDVGSEVSIGHFFKSSFARSFVTTCRDIETSNFGLINDSSDHASHENSTLCLEDKNNLLPISNGNQTSQSENNFQSTSNVPLSDAELQELNQLRKQCQVLNEENRRLQNTLQMHETSQFQAIDNVMLQTQIETLQWQLKQTEANRQMYRSLMKQVVNFLERAQKSLDNLHASNSRSHKNIGKSTRNLSIYADESSSNQSNSFRSISPTSKFTRAKSVTQISSVSGSSGFRDFTWSVLRRNDPVHCTPPRNKIDSHSQFNLNKSYDGVISRQNNDVADAKEKNDHVPPKKLSQEAFRLMRTVESLLAMREPNLLTVSPSNSSSSPSSSPLASSSSSAVVADDDNTSNSLIDHSVTTNSNKSTTSTSFDDGTYEEYSRFDAHEDENDMSNISNKLSNTLEISTTINNNSNINNSNIYYHNNTLRSCSPNVSNMLLDTTSLHSASSKTTEEEDLRPPSVGRLRQIFVSTPSSTSNREIKKVDIKENGHSRFKEKEKPVANSISSVEDESGFSSMNSFQDIGLPLPTISPIKEGCHTEVGLPEIPLDKINHRRWSSTPAEIQAMFKKYKNGYLTNSTKVESMSVWV